MKKLYGKALLSSFVAAALFFNLTVLLAVEFLGWVVTENVSHGTSWVVSSMHFWAVLFFIPSVAVALIAVPLPGTASNDKLRAAVDAGWWGMFYLNPLGLLCVALRHLWRRVLLPIYALFGIACSGLFRKDDSENVPQA